MDLQKRKEALFFLGDYLRQKDERLYAHLHRTHYKNRWFTIENQYSAIDAICDEFLNPEKLNNWISNYQIKHWEHPKKIGLIPAANIPLVWFHDVFCIFISGHDPVVKLSDRDEYLLPFLVKKMNEEFPGVEQYFSFPENIAVKELDAIIATGSNNSSRYFDYYFRKMKNIIRSNRNSVGILDGSETQEELKELGDDICNYFGLGCRSVSKLYVPKNYDFVPLLEILHERKDLVLHEKYKNNYDYQTTILILNKTPYWNNGSSVIVKNNALASPISVIHFEEYEKKDELEKILLKEKNNIQCIVSKSPLDRIDSVPLGKAQCPGLSDYADGIDTMEFLQDF